MLVEQNEIWQAIERPSGLTLQKKRNRKVPFLHFWDLVVMYYFYVLYSLKDGRLYKGYSEQPGKRFGQHMSGQVRSTRYRRPMIIVHVEAYASKKEAMARERQSKTLEGGTRLKELLRQKGILGSCGLLKK